jgi:hypothetical protein
MAAGKRSEREIKGKIRLILSQVEPAARIYHERGLAEAMRDAALTGEVSEFYRLAGSLGAKPNPIAAPGQFAVTHPQVEILRALYTSLPAPRQRKFATMLLSEISERTARVIVHTILDLGYLKVLETFLSGSTASVPVRVIAWSTVKDALAHEPHRFTELDLSTLERMQKTDRKRFPERKHEPEDSIIIPRGYNV